MTPLEQFKSLSPEGQKLPEHIQKLIHQASVKIQEAACTIAQSAPNNAILLVITAACVNNIVAAHKFLEEEVPPEVAHQMAAVIVAKLCHRLNIDPKDVAPYMELARLEKDFHQ